MVHIIYARKFSYSFSEIRDFSAKLPISRLVSCFSNMLHDGFHHADGFTYSFALMQKNKVTKRKKSRLRLRAYSGKAVLALKNELAPLHCAQTAFFSTARPFLRSRPYA